jgi:predicted unusual protein kinase regulating ubiquinone biosynthesis (AarF/ABC1/UbiB family)
LSRFDPKTDGTSKDWGLIFQESARTLWEEIDYVREGRNANRFANNFKAVPWIKAPDIQWELSSSKVLTMEFVSGIKISDVEKVMAVVQAVEHAVWRVTHSFVHIFSLCCTVLIV